MNFVFFAKIVKNERGGGLGALGEGGGERTE